jgi:uncharacterized small protein (DUF1192 family)
MNEKNGFKTPTPADTLEQQIIDPSFPKNEREWWASEEIARLRAEVEALKLQRTAADLVHRDTSTTVLVQAGEIEELRRSNGALLRTKDALQRELARVRAEVEALRAKATAFDWLQAEHDRFDPMARCVIKRSMDRRNGDWIEFIDGENFAAIVLREASIDAARATQGGKT